MLKKSKVKKGSKVWASKTRIGERSWFRCITWFNSKEKLQLEAQALDHGQLKQIDVKLLKRGEYQPRRFIHEHDLQELASSIENMG